MGILQRLFGKKDEALPWDRVDELSNERIQKVLSPVVSPRLAAFGFSEQKPLHWLRSEDRPVRQLFAFARFKGGVLAPRWGLSLDFVPHVAGSNVAWHRTEKSARFDLVVDANDYGSDELQSYFVFGEEFLAREAESITLPALRRARIFWDRFASVEDLPAAFEWWKASFGKSGLRFDMKANHLLGYAFSLAVNGRADEARSQLDMFLKREPLREVQATRLLGLLDDAAGAVGPPDGRRR